MRIDFNLNELWVRRIPIRRFTFSQRLYALSKIAPPDFVIFNSCSIRVNRGWVGLTSFEANQGYLRRTIEPHRHPADASPGRGVSLHPAQVPQSVVELFPLKLVTDQRHPLFEADLSAVGMSAEIEIVSVGSCSLR